MYTERLAIQDSLRDIERRLDEAEKEMMELRNYKMQLRTERTQYIQRLREIDDRDMKSNSIDVMEHLSSKLTDVVGQISTIIPDIPATTWIEHFQKNQSVNPSIIDNSPQDPEPSKVQEAAQEQQLNSKAYGKKSKEQNAAIIKQIIEENGPEVNLRVIENEFVKRTNLRYKAFNDQVKTAMSIFPSIKRVRQGTYAIMKQPILNFVTKEENTGPETAVN